jgi:1,4-dihydroxy-2-naphthoyl-CoA synthase
LEQFVNKLLMATADSREGASAFADKRPPQFKGE